MNSTNQRNDTERQRIVEQVTHHFTLRDINDAGPVARDKKRTAAVFDGADIR